MNRTRAHALVLVNWQGVFYERYLLDKHVTALEGPNGAGKTTVMIAAYVVLLPDMSRLRFTNLGETGATGGDKGIWGRLGELGRPSYAALDFVLADSRRLIAGVHLERKGEPSVEPTPFLLTDLDADVRLQDLMLLRQGDYEAVPELAELRENAGRLGGRLQVFSTAREYFAALFDHGVTPMRLGTDEERNKLNEMLRTSMTGGISRVLTSELRSFLLKEESGLADTLQTMRANLDACRRTRIDVQESQRLEREIGEVFEAGQAMFVAAYLATRERASELQRRAVESETARTAALRALQEAQDALARATESFSSAEARRLELETSLQEARRWLDRLQQALAAWRDLAKRRRDLEEAVEAEARATGHRALAEQERDARKAALRRAQDDYGRAANGLEDLEKGLEELHRRADAHRQVMRRWTLVGSSMGDRERTPSEISSILRQRREELEGVDAVRRGDLRNLADAEAHRGQFAELLRTLVSVCGSEVDAGAARNAALDVLHTQRSREALASRIPDIARDRDEALRLAARQHSTRERAQRLGVSLEPGSSSQGVRLLLDEAESAREGHTEAERTARSDLAATERILADSRSRRRELLEREAQWTDLQARATRLEQALAESVVDRAGLDAARARAVELLRSATHSEERLTESIERSIAAANALDAGRGAVDSALLRMKDDLDAELLSSTFDDIPIEQAGIVEARLGSLAHALVVDDPHACATAIADRPGELSTVWLVSREAADQNRWADEESLTGALGDVIVEEGPAVRVTRIPNQPSLGRKARRRRAEELRKEAQRFDAEREETRARRRACERNAADADALLAGCAVWLAGDPAPSIAELDHATVEHEARIDALRRNAARHADAAAKLRPRIEALRDLLADAHLLDAPDHAERARQLTQEHRSAKLAFEEAAKHAPACRVLEEGLEVLKRLPLTEPDVEALRRRVVALQEQRDLLDAAIEALEYAFGHFEAFAWVDAEATLGREEALMPGLKHQLVQSKAAMDAADRESEEAAAAYEAATAAWRGEDARRGAALEQVRAAESRFLEVGVDEPTEEAERGGRREVERLEAEQHELTTRVSLLAAERGRCEMDGEQKAQVLQAAEERLENDRREAEPAVERWHGLRARAAEHNLLSSVNAMGSSDVSGIRGHVNLVQESNRQSAVLIERLRSAQGGLKVIQDMMSPPAAEIAFGDASLEKWLVVRDWLRRRLPAQVAEVDDPSEALLRLRDQLASLEARLSTQEQDLRGASEDVARGIDVHIRKARGQVNRLNKHLDGVAFGHIDRIRVRLEPVDRMEQVLRALRAGEAQTLLFQGDIPIEEALDEIFRRYGGGRTGGQRLLDYREYIHLQVQIRRSARADWEAANPTRVSTGEAIGVGAALMMVVLTEWERDANLLRGRRSSGSLRLLFLDEANRLSNDNLATLFDLCQNLDLQLLIAAPEVARAEGNTTYHLARFAKADGREEVVVSGRRIRGEA